MNPIEEFKNECKVRVANYSRNAEFMRIQEKFMLESISAKYSYNFTWLGCPIIQYPQDIVALQEIIWRVTPDLIIETGIARGGSIIFSASMLSLLETCRLIDRGRVVGIDIDIRPHNRKAIEQHPLKEKIEMIEGSSIDESVLQNVHQIAKEFQKILVILDSNHTHDHVLAELDGYAHLVTKGSYCVVFDTIIEDLPESFFSNRPWGKNNNPKTAVWEFLESNPGFEIDKEIENKLQVTVAPDGYLRKL